MVFSDWLIVLELLSSWYLHLLCSPFVVHMQPRHGVLVQGITVLWCLNICYVCISRAEI